MKRTGTVFVGLGWGLMALLLFHGVGALGASSAYSDGIVAIINDEVITVYDVALFASEAERQIQQHYADEALNAPETRRKMVEEIGAVRKKAAYRLIDRKLIYSEFNSKGYHVPTELIERRVDSVVARRAGGDWGKFDDMLEASNMSLADFRKDIEEQLAVQLLVNQEINRKIVISPEQVEAYYREHAGEFSEPTTLHFFLMEFKGTESERTKKAAAATRALAAGETFAAVAARLSEGPNKEQGGDLGWLKMGDLRPEFRDGLGTLKAGATSGPVALGESTFIVHASEVKVGSTRNFDAVAEAIRSQLHAQEREKRLAAYVDRLREKASIRVFFKE